MSRIGINQQAVIDFLTTNTSATEQELKNLLIGKNYKKVIEEMMRRGMLNVSATSGHYVLPRDLYKCFEKSATRGNANKTSKKKVKSNSEKEEDDYSQNEFQKRITISDSCSRQKENETVNLFEFTYCFLKDIVEEYWQSLSSDEFTEVRADELINNYLNTANATNDLNDVFKELCSSLQTSSMLNNVIGFYRPERQRGIRNALFDFDVIRVANLESYDTVYERLRDNLAELGINFGDSWDLYAKGVYSGAKFIARFSTYEELISSIQNFENYPNNTKHLSFPEYQKKHTYSKEGVEPKATDGVYKIPLMGDVIALNWMKEIGLNNGKPDTHILDVFVECQVLPGGNRANLVGPCEQLLEDMAERYGLNDTYNNYGVYALDKAVWLCCSGHFYRHLNKKYSPEYRIPNGITIQNTGWKQLKKRYLVEMMIAKHNGELQL